jgi:hypothetical protein
MAFSGNYSVSQGVDVQSFTLTDTSTGSDVNLTGRTIALYQANGSLLGGATINWPLSDGSTKALTGYLPKDYSLLTLVTWQSSSPIPGSSYSKSSIYTFTGNSNAFAYGLLQQIAAMQAITSDNGFEDNVAILNSEIQNAGRASTYGDQGNAQQCLDRIYNMIINQQFYF